MAVLLLGEVTDGRLNRDATARAVGAVKGLGEITVLCAGSAADGAATEAATIAGVNRVLLASSDAYDHRLAEPLTALIVSLAADYSHIAAPATSNAKNVLPRVAALLDVMVLSEVSGVVDANTFERPIYAGNAIQTVRSRDATKVLTIRTAGFEAAGSGDPVPVATAAENVGSSLSSWIADEVATSDRPELTSAARVVAGGRGLGSKENFDVVVGLADKLGAAVGASRAAVDAGYAPNDWQIGQTGKVVAPDLYVAVGISGAIQHLAGMKDSKVIVAINKDADAPIFQIADYGIEGDLFSIVAEFTAKI